MASPIKVTLYGRPGCHLCEDAAAMLSRIGRRIPIEVQHVNIESDDGLLARYLVEIPVISAGDMEIARAPIREGPLEAALREQFEAQGERQAR